MGSWFVFFSPPFISPFPPSILVLWPISQWLPNNMSRNFRDLAPQALSVAVLKKTLKKIVTLQGIDHLWLRECGANYYKFSRIVGSLEVMVRKTTLRIAATSFISNKNVQLKLTSLHVRLTRHDQPLFNQRESFLVNSF